ERAAKRKFEQLGPDARIPNLLELAESYPMSTVAVEALHRAAKAYMDRQPGRMEEVVDEAVAILERAEWWGTDDQLARIYGYKAQLYEQAGRLISARSVLRNIPRDKEQMKPIRDGKPVVASAWIAELEKKLAEQGIAGQLKLGLDFKRPVHLEGRLLVPAHRVSEAERSPLFVLLGPQGQHLNLYHTRDLKKRWSATITKTETRLISLNATRLWIWQPKAQRLELFSTAAGGGKPIHRVDIEQTFGTLGGAQRKRQADQLQRSRVGGETQSSDPFRHEATVLASNGRDVAVGDAAGRLAVFNHTDGRLLWKKATPVLSTSHLHLSRGRVMISGLDAQGASVLCVYDIKSAAEEKKLRFDGDETILWAGLNDLGLLVYVLPDRVEGYDLRRGQSAWVSKKPNVTFSDGDQDAQRRLRRRFGRAGAQHPPGLRALMGADRLMLETVKPQQSVVWVDMTRGAMTEPKPLVGKVGRQIHYDQDSGFWLIRGNSRAIAYDGEGHKLWHDAITLPVLRVSHTITEEFVVMFSSPIDQQALNKHGDRTRFIYLLKRSGGLLIGEYRMPTPAKVDRVTAVGGRLLIGSSNGHSTMVLKGGQGR
ncbi:MAG: hypothetical protein R3236_09640, partial [Phycisphaeraceae bacterium]|nr:hypothetical protein [Phycisphaeraceae bacterium]